MTIPATDGPTSLAALNIDEFTLALKEIARLNATMIVHAEDAATIEHAPAAHGQHYAGG